MKVHNYVRQQATKVTKV